jgi:hypothetical protein
MALLDILVGLLIEVCGSLAVAVAFVALLVMLGLPVERGY